MFLSDQEYRGVSIAARTTSVVSLLGSLFIVGTFACFPYFRKPINRLICYATAGNIMVNIATLIATSALPQPGALRASVLCEFQGILIQWFMSADAYWDFCMAINVLLVFFFGYDSGQLLRKEPWYFAFAYGVPGIPSITYIVLDHAGHSIIGTATIWCWVNKENDWMRFAFFYGPVWIVIIATFTIYLVTGIHIFSKASLLRDFNNAATGRPDMAFSPIVTPAADNPFADLNNIVVTTEIGHSVDQESAVARTASSADDGASMISLSSTHNLSQSGNAMGKSATSAPPALVPVHSTYDEKAVGLRAPNQRTGNGRAGYRATVFATSPGVEPTTNLPGSLVPNQLNTPHTGEMNQAAMAYLKVALLMFLAIVMVWVPSTINRLYSFVHQDENPNFGLNLTSSIVLPLQGAWSAIIYTYTTRSECKRAYAEIRDKISGGKAKKQRQEELKLNERKRMLNDMRDARRRRVDIELEDMY